MKQLQQCIHINYKIPFHEISKHFHFCFQNAVNAYYIALPSLKLKNRNIITRHLKWSHTWVSVGERANKCNEYNKAKEDFVLMLKRLHRRQQRRENILWVLCKFLLLSSVKCALLHNMKEDFLSHSEMWCLCSE